jgi:predicted transcriptional regulator
MQRGVSGLRRSRFEIGVQILEIMRRGEKIPTRIMYASNTNYPNFKRVVDLLIENELIKVYDNKGRDRRTPTLY